ncbi:MAG: alcohol dehydrogenase catalytic domain-containing protein [Trebonia sp.]
MLARRGAPGYATGWPYVPGMEVAGEVVALGSGVVGFAVGDPVVAFSVDGGGLAGTVVAEAALCVRIPSGLEPAAAATVPLSWAVALGLTRSARIGETDGVLVTGAGGSSATALLPASPTRRRRPTPNCAETTGQSPGSASPTGPAPTRAPSAT